MAITVLVETGGTYIFGHCLMCYNATLWSVREIIIEYVAKDTQEC